MINQGSVILFKVNIKSVVYSRAWQTGPPPVLYSLQAKSEFYFFKLLKEIETKILFCDMKIMHNGNVSVCQ
jgi:hypothetical protein